MLTTDNTAKITEIAATQLEVDPGEIGETDLLVEDHGADAICQDVHDVLPARHHRP
jgi:acyl carrier protein